MTDYTVNELNLSNLNLTVLPDLSLYTNLRILHCNNNQLTSLDILPPDLRELYCYHNLLTSLDNLPLNLRELYCGGNQITRLGGADFRGSDNDRWTLVEEGAQRLTKTESAFGTSLNNLPLNLRELYCYNNQLISLDNLPPNLQILYCHNNQLISLDNIPPNLQILYCIENPIYETCKELYGFKLSTKTIEQYNEIKRLEKECCPMLK